MNKFIKLLSYIFIVILSVSRLSFAMDKIPLPISQIAMGVLIIPISFEDNMHLEEDPQMCALRNMLHLGVDNIDRLSENKIKEFLTFQLKKYDLQFLSNFKNYMKEHYIRVERKLIIDSKIYKYLKQLINKS